ncbi:unnamed protein product [Rotaria magnacalcarata]|uniref:Coiled-coil and C2 domain-containing protein 2A n=1 Tax=Rotaria magnacalcarata TaxID=392030 RepID=A0A816MBU6_9BILA|nr:unnamed protein product [Rotaria magnacalcarata]
MDPPIAQRRRGRRTRSSTSQENLIKDSSSDVSPRESSAPAAVNDRRRQRRVQRLPTNQQYDNQAFAEDERPPPHPIERVNEDEEEDEENVQNAERLATHVVKQHQRNVNEVQQQIKKPKRATTSDSVVDDDKDALDQQIGEQQRNLLKRVGNIDGGHVLPVEPLPSTIGASRDRSLEQILEKAKRARAGQPMDGELMSTMGSSRRFGASSELKLQRTLGKLDTHIDATLFSTSTMGGDTSTRFDMDNIHDKRIRQEIEKKQHERKSRWKETADQLEIAPSVSEKDDFFLKIWTEQQVDVQEPPTASARVAPVTTADNIVGGEATDEAAVSNDQASGRDKNLPEEQQLLLPMLEDVQLAQYQRAERAFDEDEENDLEQLKYKYVVGRPIGLREKFGDEAFEPRSLEDEGIFVGKKPTVPAKVVNRAEKRIYEECIKDNKPTDHWFGPDGALITLPDPTKFVPTRPLIDDLFDPALGKEFYKAYQIDSEHGVASDPIGADRYRLDLDLEKISFIHHHYMSIEHVLAMRMKQMYQHYTVRKQQRIVQQLSDKIKALKSAESNCRTLYEQNKYGETDVPKELHERLTNYQNELRQARNQRCNEMKLDRQLLKSLLDTWQKVKDIRRTNGYSTTSLKLIIKQISGKRTKHYEQMQQQIEEEIVDEIALAEEQYQHETKAHSLIARKRKLQDIRKKKARQDLEKKRAAAMNTYNPDVENEQADIAIINEEEIYVPDKPEPRKPDEIRTTILAKYQNALRPPDEPEVLLEVVYTEHISTESECSARERARRHHLQTATDIIARIIINGKVMADTPAVRLTGDFEANFGQIFPCYVVRTPETIKIEFYESSARFRSPLAELYLPVPEQTVTSENYQLQGYEFSSNILREYNPNQTTAVGSGIHSPIQIPDGNLSFLNIEGILNAGISWGVQDGVTLVPPDYTTSKAYLSRQMGGGIPQDISMQAINLSNMKNLIEWIKQSNLDPYDPDNAFLINIMKDYSITRADTNFEINTLQHFRLSIDENDEMDQDQEQMDIDTSLRFKLLQARKENIPDFKDFRDVPAYDYLVRKKYGVFKRFMIHRQEAADGDSVDQQIHGKRQTRIDIVRRQGERQLRKMREQVLARIALATGRKTFSEMVVEESIPNIQALRGLLSSIYIEPTRPLYPSRRRTEQKKVTNLALAANREVYILVNLIGAMDLPIRRSVLTQEGPKAGSQAKQAAERMVNNLIKYS